MTRIAVSGRGSAVAVVAMLVAFPALAAAMRSDVVINTGSQVPASEQPAGGVAVTYLVTLAGGDLDGCKMAVTEQLFPRDEGAWGIFRVAADVACEKGGFGFTSAGAWDASGFHGAGEVVPGSGSGSFDGFAARIAQIGSSMKPGAASGTTDISYVLLVDPLTP